jgi:hypothetical protein
MAFVEEVFKNKGGLFGAQTGRKYESSETEEKGGSKWSKPDATPSAPGELIKEVCED